MTDSVGGGRGRRFRVLATLIEGAQLSALRPLPTGSPAVASLARPGGNVTGLSLQSNEIAGKRLELLREVVPSLRRVAILANVGNPFSVLELGEAQVNSRSNSAKPPSTVSMRRPCGVVVSAHVSLITEALCIFLFSAPIYRRYWSKYQERGEGQKP